MYNEYTTFVRKWRKHFGIELKKPLAEMMNVSDGDEVSLVFKHDCVELRLLKHGDGTSTFDNLKPVGTVVQSFVRHFGEGTSGQELFTADKDYFLLYDTNRLVALMKYKNALADWLKMSDATYREAKNISWDEVNKNKHFIIEWRQGKPHYVADAYFAYHAILVLEAMMILGEGCHLFYPDKPAPMCLTDHDKNWCILIRPRVKPELKP